MSAVRKEIATEGSIKIDSYPASEKVYLSGSRPDIQVPMRKITLSDTPAHFGAEKNPPLYVYDTSGVYTDPHVEISLHKGLSTAVRGGWFGFDPGRRVSGQHASGRAKPAPGPVPA